MKKSVVLLLVIFLCSCGFTPLYKQTKVNGSYSSATINEMSKIRISAIKDRFGQQLRNELLDLITPKGSPVTPTYRLDVKLAKKRVIQQAMRNDVTATNERIEYLVTYKLLAENNTLVEGDSIAFVSYDILTNPYSTTTAQKKAETDAAKILANDIALRIAAYFHSRNNGLTK